MIKLSRRGEKVRKWGKRVSFAIRENIFSTGRSKSLTKGKKCGKMLIGQERIDGEASYGRLAQCVTK
jgi:hypothetical protein